MQHKNCTTNKLTVLLRAFLHTCWKYHAVIQCICQKALVTDWKIIVRAFPCVCFLSGHCLLVVLLYCRENTSHGGEMEHLRESYASRGVPFIFMIIEPRRHYRTINICLQKANLWTRLRTRSNFLPSRM